MNYFIRLENANDVRRHLLESSKEIIEGLKGYYRVLEIRDQKREVALELQHTMKELHMLLDELEKMMPEKSLKEIEEFLPKPEKPGLKLKAAAKKGKGNGSKKVVQIAVGPHSGDEEEEANPAKPATPTAPPKPKKRTEIEKLDSALSSIEDRLKKLA